MNNKSKQHEESMTPGRIIKALQKELETARTRIAKLESREQALSAGCTECKDSCRQLLEESTLAYQSLDEDGRILYVNPTWLKLLGRDRQEVVGRFFTDFMVKKHHAAFQDDFVRYKTSGSTRNLEYDLIHQDGSVRHVLLDGCISNDEQQRFQCTHCLLLDITGQKRTEEAFLSADQQRRIIIDSVPAFIWSKDTEGRFLMVNESLSQALGLKKDAIIGKKTHDLFPLDIAHAHTLTDQRILTDGEPELGIEESFVTASGEMGWCISDKIPLQNLQGKIIGTIGFSRDITNQRIFQQALTQSETLLRNLFDHMPCGAAIYSVRGDGTRGADYVITEYNAVGVQMENKAREEVVGKSLKDLHPGIDAHPVMDNLHHVWSTGKSKFVPAYQYRDEQENMSFWLENRIFKLPTGEIVSCFEDVTARVEAEQALREREKLLRMVVENVWDGINVLDLESSRYILMSPSQVEMTGFTAEEILNITEEEIRKRTHPLDRNITISHQQRIINGQDDPGLVEYRWKVKSGEYRWFHDSHRLIRDEHGRASALVGISRDVTERKKTELKLEKMRQELQRLSEQLILAQENERKRISQELHDSVLSDILAVKMNLETCRMNLKRQDELKEIPGLDAAVHSLTETAREVRRIVLNMRPMALDELGLKDALTGLIRSFEKRAPSVVVDFSFAVPEEARVPEPQSLVVFRLIQQALDNISKHAEGVSTVRICIKRGAPGLQVEVSDDGGGFDLDRRMRRPEQSDGLGLRGMRKRVDMAGGRLDIKSAPGKGTNIQAWLPVQVVRTEQGSNPET